MNIAKYSFLLIVFLGIGCLSHKEQVGLKPTTVKGQYKVAFDTLNSFILSEDSAYLEGIVSENSPSHPIIPLACVSIKEMDTVIIANDLGYFKIKVRTGTYHIRVLNYVPIFQTKIHLYSQHIVKIFINIGYIYEY